MKASQSQGFDNTQSNTQETNIEPEAELEVAVDSRVVPFAIDQMWRVFDDYLAIQIHLRKNQPDVSEIHLEQGSPNGVGGIVTLIWRGSVTRELLEAKDDQKHTWVLRLLDGNVLFSSYQAIVRMEPHPSGTWVELKIRYKLQSHDPAFIAQANATIKQLLPKRIPELVSFILENKKVDQVAVGSTIKAPPEKVWSIIGNWEWWAFGKVQLDSSDPKLRHLQDGKITERLLEHSDEERRLLYTIEKGPFPVTGYHATIRVEPADGGSRVTYDATFDAALQTRDAFIASFKKSLEQGLNILALEAAGRQFVITFSIKAPLERMWRAVSDWDDVSWVKGVRAARIDPATNYRYLTFDSGVTVVARLLSTSAESHSMVYEVLSGPFPVALYRGQVTLSAASAAITQWTYTGRFLPKEGDDGVETAAILEKAFRERIAWIQEQFETRDYPAPESKILKEWSMVLRYWYLVGLARANMQLWKLFSTLPVPPAVKVDGPALLPKDDPDKAARVTSRVRAMASLAIEHYFADPKFLTRHTRTVPADQELPLWWKGALFFFQIQVRALMGETRFASNSGVQIRDTSVLRRMFAFLLHSSYHDSSVELDRTFVHLFLCSTGATLLRRCHELPARLLPVSLRQLKSEGPFLDDLATGRVYVVDFDAMANLPASNESVPEPIVIFRSDPAGNLRLSLIQLNGVPYTPSDPPVDWLNAKMWVLKAYVGMTRTVQHGLLSHFTWAGTFALYTYADLREKHPIRRFLAPFMRYTLSINNLAERLIINKNGALAGQVMGYEGSVELMKRMEARASYTDIVLPRDLAARGMKDFPGLYPYRDDGLLCWEALVEFAKARVAVAYADDESVVTDDELQVWAHNISRSITGFPSPVADRATLAEALTAVVYSTLLHMLHNAPAADHTIIPGHPASLASAVRKVPLPRFKGDGPQELWRHADIGNLIIALLYDATVVPYNKRLVTTFELDRYCTSEEERAAVRSFVARAEEISGVIQERNRSRSMQFPYFDMTRMAAQSVNS